MKCLYIDCFSGISGDMMLGALIDLGVSPARINAGLALLGLAGCRLRSSRTQRCGIGARSVRLVRQTEGHHHRTFGDIEKIIKKSDLPGPVQARSLDMFTRIAEAEGLVHHQKPHEVHFHEVGALDSILDIVGCAIAVEHLQIDHCCAAAVPLGNGFVQCAHGRLPVPAPATLHLLRGVPVYDSGLQAEMVTPTGAAILAHLAADFGARPAMTITRSGYGAGARSFADRPNVLRLIVGDLQERGTGDHVCVLETTIDDMNPEWAGYLMERLFERGALDVTFVPAQMKKNRPGVLVTVVCRDERCSPLTDTLLDETTTAGVRTTRARRTVVPRRTASLKTKYGALQVKLLGDGPRERVVPEYEECRRLALKKNVPLQDVYREVLRQADTVPPEK